MLKIVIPKMSNPKKNIMNMPKVNILQIKGEIRIR